MTSTGEPTARKTDRGCWFNASTKVSPYEFTASNKMKWLSYNQAYKVLL